MGAANKAKLQREFQLQSEFNESQKKNMDEISALQKQIRSLENQIQIIESRRENKTMQMKQKHEAELAQVHTRIRAAVARKDEIIAVLRMQVEDAEMRTEQLQQLLDKQRHELISGH